MITLTVPQILDDSAYQIIDDEPYSIYVINDGETTLYVGRSQDVYQRLREHFGLGMRSSGGSISAFYEQNKQHALNWTVNIYTKLECHQLTGKRCANNSRSAELAMIAHFHPCLNVSNNTEPSSVPAKYRTQVSVRNDFLEDNAVDYLDF